MKILTGLLLGLVLSTSANADIYQWFDGDGNGDLWLSSSTAAPFANLSGETLWWADLYGANLIQSNLFETNLSYANLMAANLFASIISFADLSYADLTWANLSNTQMQVTDLTSASLYGANLFGANLSFATLTGADFSYANLHFADTTNTDLSGVVGWETAAWSEAFYDIDTSFPPGMDPVAEGMIFIPAPGVIGIFLLAGIRRRRRS